MSTSQSINKEEFRNSITPDLYEVNRYIDWNDIEQTLQKYESAINYLQSSVVNGSLGIEALEVGLHQERYLYDVATILLAIPQNAIGFSDGRELPEAGSRPASHLKDIASLLLDLGFARLISSDESIRGLVRVALTGQDAGKRRYRVGATITERLKAVLAQAISAAIQENGILIQQTDETLWPRPAKGRVEYILSIENRQSIAVTSVFQTASGGRQQRELSTEYPNLQRDLAEFGLNLILVADGRGVRGARDSVLNELFNGVASCMTFRQAAAGRLLQEILRLVKTEPPSQQQRALKSIIHAALFSKGIVSAEELPSDINRTSLSLAAYANENSDLDVQLDPTGRSIAWRRKDLVEKALTLKDRFKPETALSCFSQLLASSTSQLGPLANAITYSIETSTDGDGIIPQRLFVAASSGSPNAEIVKKVAHLSLEQAADSRMAILLSAFPPDEETSVALRRLQSTLTSNVIVISCDQLIDMARSREPSRSFVARQLLEQSDLIKASPFVVNSVTPGRMFYGRETEEADMVSTLGSNSIALLGGRRIGKTSLMRHVDTRLKDGGFVTFFCDCQTVRDWDSFANMAKRLWGVTLDHPFLPAHLFELVSQLKSSSNGKMVILMDEIDQLLDWDKKHTEDQVPEAFFRACRTVSQEAAVQFVFSGERTIAGRLWDPQSPHWNFCQPLMLRQLDRNSAGQLLLKPLRGMQITIEDEDAFTSVAWKRTSGHPQLLQTLGDRLIRHLNEKPPSSRTTLSSRDLFEVADVYSYAESYLETYWGQATDLERLVSLLVATGVDTLEGCREYLHANNIARSDPEIRSGLRMLELYGITDSSESGYQMRLEWFLDAIKFYGTPNALINEYKEKL